MSDDEVARSILVAIGHPDATLAPLAAGLNSQAWRTELDGTPAVLRIGLRDAGRGSTYEIEHRVLTRVAEAGVPVPRPILGHWDLSSWDGAPFSVTSLSPGITHEVDSWESIIPALDPVVRGLGTISHRGFGPLVLRDGQLSGAEDDPSAGLQRWARRPLWPLQDRDLGSHDQLRAYPDLRERLLSAAPEVLMAIKSGPTGLVHSDLHEENILDDDGRLTIIDFGGALIAPLAWEFASFAYFAGWHAGDRLLDLATDGPRLPAMRAQTSSLALAFGAYRWRWEPVRERHPDDYHANFLESTLARVGRGQSSGESAAFG